MNEIRGQGYSITVLDEKTVKACGKAKRTHMKV